MTYRTAVDRLEPEVLDRIVGFGRHDQTDDRPPQPYWQPEDFAELLGLVTIEGAAGGAEEP